MYPDANSHFLYLIFLTLLPEVLGFLTLLLEVLIFNSLFYKLEIITLSVSYLLCPKLPPPLLLLGVEERGVKPPPVERLPEPLLNERLMLLPLRFPPKILLLPLPKLLLFWRLLFPKPRLLLVLLLLLPKPRLGRLLLLLLPKPRLG